MGKKKAVCRVIAVLWATIFLFGTLAPESVQAAAVANRIKAVSGTYPNGSYYNSYETVTVEKNGYQQSIIGHECAGFVMYVTRQVFQDTYYTGSPSYRQIYRTVSTKNTSEMKRLFSRAKIGDVIRWTGNGGRHQAIFLKKSNLGIQVYEANFGNDYNRVWYHHLWSWNNRTLWTSTASNVSVFRHKDYAKIDRMVKKVSLNKSRLSLRKGKKFKLAASVSPSNAYRKKITWKSSNPRVAKVYANGYVKGLKKGKATITATVRDGSGKKATCRVTVK